MDEGNYVVTPRSISNQSSIAESSNQISRQFGIRMLNRDWIFDIHPKDSLVAAMENNANPILILLSALSLLSLMLLQHLYFKARSSREESRLLNSRLSESLDAMLDAVIICNENGVITECNEASNKMFGYSDGSLLGQDMRVLIHDSHREIHDEYLRQFRLASKAIELGSDKNLKAKKYNGEIFPVTVRLSQSRDNQGKRIFIGVIHDLSQIALAEHNRALSEATLSAAMASSQTGWLVLDIEGKIQSVNKAFLDWLGYAEEELLNESLLKVIPATDHDRSINAWKELSQGKASSLTRERTYIGKKGQQHWGVSSKSIVNLDNQSPIILCQVVDINQQKQLQRDLEEYVAALEKSNSELDQFAYVASHDLKSPLNAIARLSSWIEDDCNEILPEKPREYLALLKGRVTRLTQLLDDLLVYSRVGRHQHEYSFVDIQDLSKELLDLNAPEKTFRLRADSTKVFVPAIPFELVLRNLISNTIKHHHLHEGTIEISTDISENGYAVHVSDDGPGIPVEFRDKAMQMFQTLQSRDETEGSGMGLAICKKTVEYYGGTFLISTSSLGGTTISMTWPIGPGSNLTGKTHEHGSHSRPH